MPFDEIPPLASPTGAKLHVRQRLAATPRGVIQINHDLAEHGGRYGGFADFLAGRGFHVYAHDHRGHGRTSAPDAPAGTFAIAGGTAKLRADLFEVHELIAREHPGLPVILFGQGAGALIGLDFLFGHAPRIRAAALWNMPVASDYPARFLRAMLGWEKFRLGSDVPSPTMRGIVTDWNRKAGGRTAFDLLSDDPAVVDAYVADPLCGFDPAVSAWLDVLRLAKRASSKAVLTGLPRDLPLHIAAGDSDPVTGFGRQVEILQGLLKALDFEHIAFRRQDGQRHDLVNGSQREAVWRDFADWAETVVACADSP